MTDRIKPVHFIAFWLVLNLFQAWATTLTSDEGYYWFYASRLEWGYYDHPPFLALLIHLGYAVIKNELGVRMIGIVLNSLSLFLLFEMLPKERRVRNIVYGLLLSLPLLNYVTFIVFPDTPLLAFSLLFLYAYKRMLEQNNWGSTLLLGLATALLLYSKYHGVLLVGFVLLSNLKLLRQKQFYAAMFLALVLFLPHLTWQYEYEFPSFRYHLSGRASAISTKHLLDFMLQQLLAIGPGIIFIPFMVRSRNQFERSLQFIAIGTLSFFLLASFRGMVHFHWTSIMLYPLVILAAVFYADPARRRFFIYAVLPFSVLIIVLRLYLAFRIIPVNNLNVDYYHGREEWAADIARVADGDVVVFENNLREAPLYVFYSGQPGLTLYPGEWKKSQYEIWRYEDSIQHKPVLVVKPKPFDNSKALKTRMGETEFYLKISDFTSYQNIVMELEERYIRAESDSLLLPLILFNHRSDTLAFQANTYG